jgi:N-carbamoyl-L-amino-acid hydrolase
MRHETFARAAADPHAAVTRARAAELFAGLRRVGDDGVGITREAYAANEAAALDVVRAFAAAHRLVAMTDRAGNLVVRAADDDGRAPAVYIGSHLDSVPQGGNFDGAAGVVAGLLLLAERPAAARPPLRVLALRAEESAFYGRANIGARALFGGLDAAALAARRLGAADGRTLAEAMAAAGIDVKPIAAGVPLFPLQQARAYLELHIEQGPVLETAGEPVAVVPGIRGNVRHRRVVCRGEAGHSGAVPRDLRHDAVFAFADLIARLDRRWQAMLAAGDDVVFTCGIVATDPAEHALTRIPGDISFSVEIRSQDVATLEAAYAGLRQDCDAVAAGRGVGFDFDARVDTAPAVLDPALTADLAASARRLGLASRLLPSGAGHDAAVFANAGVPSAMLFVRNQNGSHNPHEAMRLEDFVIAVRLMRFQLAAWRARWYQKGAAASSMPPVSP